MATEYNSNTFSLIPRRKLQALYTTLIRCRMLTELAAGKGRRKREREAPAVAMVLDLKRGDTLAAAERDLLPGFVNGASPRAVVAAMRAAPARPRVSFAAMLQATLAAARTHAQRKDGKIAVIFGRDASVDSAAWRAALRTAGEERLPVLFVSQRDGEKPAGIQKPAFPVMTVDGDDVVAIYRVVSEAQAHARRGNGATLIECLEWPFAGSGKSGKPSHDPILNMERYLAHLGVPFERWKRKAVAEFGNEQRASRLAR